MKWFKHDTDANMDAKLQEIMLDYGLEGYGLYWYCIELIAQGVNGDNLTFELEHDCRIIARNTGSTAQKVEQMMKSFIGLGLLDANNGHVFCLKLASRCDDFTAKAVRRTGVKTLKNQSVGVSPSLSDKVPLEEEEEVRRKKKEIEDNKRLFVSGLFTEFWDLYAKKTGKPNSEKEWFKISKLKDADLVFQDIFAAVKIYVAAKPDKQFRKDPERWLKYECWNDEVIINEQINANTTSTGRKESSHERIKRENDIKYRGGRQEQGGLAMGEDDGHLGRTVGEGEREQPIARLDNEPFVDY
jgi:hypothetical protein